MKPEATMMTDDMSSYNVIGHKDHQVVTHSAGEYVRGEAHTNIVEGFLVC